MKKTVRSVVAWAAGGAALGGLAAALAVAASDEGVVDRALVIAATAGAGALLALNLRAGTPDD